MPKPKTKPKPTPSRNRSQSATAVATAGQAPASPDPEAIAARAYELFLRRGAVHGQDWEDWLAAERELAADVRSTTHN
jgi:hypothetical protein